MGSAINIVATGSEALRARRKLATAPASAATIKSQGGIGDPTHPFNSSPQISPMPSQSMGKITSARDELQ